MEYLKGMVEYFKIMDGKIQSILKTIKELINVPDKNLTIQSEDFENNSFNNLLQGVLKTVANKDINQVKKQYDDLTDDYLSQFKGPNPSTPSNILQVINDWSIFSEPLFENEKINKKNFFIAIIMNIDNEKSLAFFEDRYSIYNGMKKIYDASFAQRLKNLNPENLRIEERCFYAIRFFIWLKKYVAIFGAEKSQNISAETILNLFHESFEYFKDSIIFFVKELALQEKIKSVKELKKYKFNDAMKYIKEINRNFEKIYNKYVKSKFRNKNAHCQIIQLDNERFYWYDGRTHYFTKYEVDSALSDLFIIIVFFNDVFLTGPFRAQISEKRGIIEQQNEINELVKSLYINESYASIQITKEDWIKILQGIINLFNPQSPENQPKEIRIRTIINELDKMKKNDAFSYPNKILSKSIDRLTKVGFLQKSGDVKLTIAEDCRENFGDYLQKVVGSFKGN